MASAMDFAPGVFKSLDANPGGTFKSFDKYIDKIELAFLKFDGTPYAPTDKEKKQCLESKAYF